MDHALPIDAQVSASFNYTLTRASNATVARIIAWFQGFSEAQASEVLPNLIDALRAPTESIRSLAARAIRAAQGAGVFLDEMQIDRRHNLVPSIFRNALTNKFAGNSVGTTFNCNYVALGTDSTAASNADTELGTETLRAAFTDRSAADNVAYFDAFFASTEVGGNTYSEVGIFADGTGTADSGYLASRVIINEAMGANETLTINATITVV